MNPTLTALAVILLAGCSSAPTTEDSSPTGQPPSSSVPAPSPSAGPGGDDSPIDWRPGEAVEQVDCAGIVFNLFADRSAVEPLLPAGFTIPGSGPVPVFLTEETCSSAVLENRTLQEGVHFGFAFVDVTPPDTPEGPERQSFLLEFSTSWELVQDVTSAARVPGGPITLTTMDSVVGHEVAVKGPQTSYDFTVATNPWDQLQVNPLEVRLWGGMDGSFTMTYSRTPSLGDRFSFACLAMFESGALAAIFPDPAPCLATKQSISGTFTLEKSRSVTP